MSSDEHEISIQFEQTARLVLKELPLRAQAWTSHDLFKVNELLVDFALYVAKQVQCSGVDLWSDQKLEHFVHTMKDVHEDDHSTFTL